MALNKEQKAWLEKVNQYLPNFRYVPKELITQEFCINMVKTCGFALQFLLEEHKTEDVYLAMFQQKKYTWFMLKYVPDMMKTEAVCLAAVKKWYYNLKFVPDMLKAKVEAALKDDTESKTDIEKMAGHLPMLKTTACDKHTASADCDTAIHMAPILWLYPSQEDARRIEQNYSLKDATEVDPYTKYDKDGWPISE